MAAGTSLNHIHVSHTRVEQWQEASQLPNEGREHFRSALLDPTANAGQRICLSNLCTRLVPLA